MSDIKQIWQQAKDEFKDRAFERFVIKTGTEEGDIYPRSNETVEIELRLGVRDLQLKPLPELFAHDIEVYGENAYLMWECNPLKDGVRQFKNNDDVVDAFENFVGMNTKRKTSGALPFDLQRAKKGDTVEEKYNDGYWDIIKNEKFKNSFILNGRVYMKCVDIDINDLRMKYPPKVAR